MSLGQGDLGQWVSHQGRTGVLEKIDGDQALVLWGIANNRRYEEWLDLAELELVPGRPTREVP